MIEFNEHNLSQLLTHDRAMSNVKIAPIFPTQRANPNLIKYVRLSVCPSVTKDPQLYTGKCYGKRQKEKEERERGKRRRKEKEEREGGKNLTR